MEGFLLVCVFVLLVMIVRNRSKQKNERAEDRKIIRDLTTRIYFLEGAVTKLKHEPAAVKEHVAEATPEVKVVPPPKPAAPIQPVAPPAPQPKPPQEVVTASVKAPPIQVPLKAPVVAPPIPPVKPVETTVAAKPAVPPPHVVAPVTAPTSAPAPVHRVAVPPPPVEPPRFAAAQRKPAKPLKEQIKSFFDWVEAKLGEKWLGKIGISFVVLGIAAYLGTKVPNTPASKAIIGFTASLAILGGGIWLERKERYRTLARSLIGGGWAALFFVSWAIYNLQATQVITSATLDYVLMLAVAIGMVWHTLRFRSQVVTGLAYLLAFLTVGLNHDQVAFANSLGAGVLLAVGLAVIVLRFQWYELEVFGILAGYLNHFLWVRPNVEQHLPYPALLGAAVLVVYWLIFRVSYVLRKNLNPAQERLSTFSALLNPALLLALLKYQSVHKEWAFWGLLAIGAIETALGQLPITRRRRTAVVVLSTLGVVLLVAAFWFQYAGTYLSVMWLVEAEALLLIGVWTREIVFRRLGLITALLVSAHMLVVDAYRVYAERAASQLAATGNFQLALFFAIAAIVFYANAHWISRRWPELFDRTFDRRLLQRLSYIASLMAFIAAWLAFTESWTAVAWCALAAGLTRLARRLALSELFYQANVLSAAGVVRALLINLDATASYGHFSLRFITISLVAVLLYFTAHWSWATNKSAQLSSWQRFANAGYTWAASILLGVLVWYELHEAHAASIAVIWAVGGLTLAWLGRKLSKNDLTYQANAAALAAVARVWLVNYGESEIYYSHFTLRLITVTAVAVLLYVSSHWSWPKHSNAVSKSRWTAAVYTWAGTLLLAALAWYEVRVAAVAIVWAVGGLVLALIGRRFVNRNLTYQANLLAFAAFVESILFNYSATHLVFHRFTERLISVTLTAVLLYVTSRWSWVEESGDREFIVGKSSFPFSRVVSGTYIWAGSTLLAFLAWYELFPVSVAVAWMLGGLVLLELGLVRKSVSLRVQAYVALISAFARIFVVNLNASGEGISPRLYTIVPIALALFYTYWRLLQSESLLRASEQKSRIAILFCWLGTATIAALLRFELQPDWVATGWAALALILLAAACFTRRTFLHQALVFVFAIASRTVFHNFYQRSYFPPPQGAWQQSRWVLVGITVMLLYLGLPFLFRLRIKGAGETSHGLISRMFGGFDRRPEQLFFFFATGLLTAMLWLEMTRGMLTLSWGLEGLAIFLMGLIAGERSFRLTGLGLLVLCAAKIIFRDVWQLQQRSDQYLTLVVLGAALVLVSFLYTRYQEKIKQYL